MASNLFFFFQLFSDTNDLSLEFKTIVYVILCYIKRIAALNFFSFVVLKKQFSYKIKRFIQFVFVYI